MLSPSSTSLVTSHLSTGTSPSSLQTRLTLRIDFALFSASFLPLLKGTALEPQLQAYARYTEEKAKEINQLLLTSPLAAARNLIIGYREDIQRRTNAIQITQELSQAQKAAVHAIKSQITEGLKKLIEDINFILVDPDIKYKTAALFYSQSIVNNASEYKTSFEQTLAALSESLPQKPGPTVFISYAWPLPELMPREYWVQPFLKRLALHLKMAGLQVKLDIGGEEVNGNPVAGGLVGFMEFAEKCDYVLLMCTESLGKKHLEGHGTRAVNTELNNILTKVTNDNQITGEQRVFPILLSGTHANAYPIAYQKYHEVLEWREFSYANNIKQLIAKILPIHSHRESWENLFTKHRILTEIPNKEFIESLIQMNEYQNLQKQLENDKQYKLLLAEMTQHNESLESKADSSPTLLLAENEKQDLRVERLRQKILNDENLTTDLENYIPARCAPPTALQKTQDLEQAAIEFIASNKSVFLLVGNAGSGKSTFNHYLEKKLWEKYKPGDAIPLFIPLPLLDDPHANLIEQGLNLHGFTASEISALKKSHKFTLILDAFDEAELKRNIWISNQFGLADIKNRVQLIIACKTDYRDNLNNYKPIFMPYAEEKPRAELFTELSVVPFDKTQILEYIKKYINNHLAELTKAFPGSEWRQAETYFKKLYEIKGLSELITNPYLLSIAMQVLPHIAILYSKLEDKERFLFTEAKLLDQFMIYHFSRVRDKMVQYDEKEFHPGIMEDFYIFSTDLAWKMKQNNMLHITFLASRSRLRSHVDSKNLFSEFFSSDPDYCAARKGCPLVTLGPGVITFQHPKLIDSFAARYRYDQDVERNPAEALQHMSDLQLQSLPDEDLLLPLRNQPMGLHPTSAPNYTNDQKTTFFPVESKNEVDEDDDDDFALAKALSLSLSLGQNNNES